MIGRDRTERPGRVPDDPLNREVPASPSDDIAGLDVLGPPAHQVVTLGDTAHLGRGLDTGSRLDEARNTGMHRPKAFDALQVFSSRRLSSYAGEVNEAMSHGITGST